MRTALSRTRVRYKETDQMAIAHHANYVVWFEIGRTDLCREYELAEQVFGLPVEELARKSFRFAFR